MRNRIAHGYLLVDTDIVRRTVEHDIPPILTSIEAELTASTEIKVSGRNRRYDVRSTSLACYELIAGGGGNGRGIDP